MTPLARISLHTFRCHTDDCCPELSRVPSAEPAREFVITDDHGGSIQLSLEQLEVMLATDVGSLGI